MSWVIACRNAFPLLRGGRRCWTTGARNFTTNNQPAGRSSQTRRMILLGVGAAAGTSVALVIRSQQESVFKQWMDEYVPGWASVVDDINVSIVEWVSQKRNDFFGSGKDPEPVIQTKSLPTQDRSKHDEPTKNEIKKEGRAFTIKQDLEPVLKATSDIHPSPDYGELAELEKSLVETTSSLKEKVGEGYQQLLNEKDAPDAGLISLVTEVHQEMFTHMVSIRLMENIFGINKIIPSAFDYFISDLSKELAALDALSDVNPGLEEHTLLILAKRNVKLLRYQLEQVSPEEIAKSLENFKMKFSKSYVEKMQNAMNESLADMQQRIEAKLREVMKKHDIESLEQLRRQAFFDTQSKIVYSNRRQN